MPVNEKNKTVYETATRLAQLDQRQSAEQGFVGSNAGQTINQGLKTASKVMLAVIKNLVLVQMITSLVGHVKSLALCPLSFFIS